MSLNGAKHALALILALAVAFGPPPAFAAPTSRLESGPAPKAVVNALLPIVPTLSQGARLELGRFLVQPSLDVSTLAKKLTDTTHAGVVPPGALKPAVEFLAASFQSPAPEQREAAAEKLVLLGRLLSPSLSEVRQRELAAVAAQAKSHLSKEQSLRVENTLKRIAGALDSSPEDERAAPVAAVGPGKPNRWRLQPADLFLDGRKFADAVARRMAGRWRPLSVVPRWGLAARLYHGSPWEQIGGRRRRESKAGKLHTWLLAQPDHSVTPDALLLRAIQLARGSVWRALTMSWTVLVLDNYNGRQRNYLEKTLKLVDIRGDAALLPLLHDPYKRYKWTSRADNFSAWYHFWGAMLAAYAYESARSPWLPVPGHWFSKWMILLEEFFQSPYEWFMKKQWRAFLDHPKRLEIDVQGAVAGSRLAANLRAPPSKRTGRHRNDNEEPYLLAKPAGFRIMRTTIELAAPIAALIAVLAWSLPAIILTAYLILFAIMGIPPRWVFAISAAAALLLR